MKTFVLFISLIINILIQAQDNGTEIIGFEKIDFKEIKIEVLALTSNFNSEKLLKHYLAKETTQYIED